MIANTARALRWWTRDGVVCYTDEVDTEWGLAVMGNGSFYPLIVL